MDDMLRLRNNGHHLLIRASLQAIQSTLLLQKTMLQSDHTTFTDIKSTIVSQNANLQNFTKNLAQTFSKISTFQPPPNSSKPPTLGSAAPLPPPPTLGSAAPLQTAPPPQNSNPTPPTMSQVAATGFTTQAPPSDKSSTPPSTVVAAAPTNPSSPTNLTRSNITSPTLSGQKNPSTPSLSYHQTLPVQHSIQNLLQKQTSLQKIQRSHVSTHKPPSLDLTGPPNLLTVELAENHDDTSTILTPIQSSLLSYAPSFPLILDPNKAFPEDKINYIKAMTTIDNLDLVSDILSNLNSDLKLATHTFTSNQNSNLIPPSAATRNVMNLNSSPTLTLKLITIAFNKISKDFSNAIWIEGEIVKRVGLSAANVDSAPVGAAVFVGAFSRVFCNPKIRHSFVGESFNEALSKPTLEFQKMFGTAYMDCHLSPTYQLNGPTNTFCFQLQLNSSPVNESKIYVFDPGGTSSLKSFFDLEDKVDFEGDGNDTALNISHEPTTTAANMRPEGIINLPIRYKE